MKTCASLVLLAAIGLVVVVAATTRTDKEKQCKGNDFNCGDKCIPKKFVCDGTYDCGDGKDELKCHNTPRRAHAPEDTLGMDAPTFDLEFL